MIFEIVFYGIVSVILLAMFTDQLSLFATGALMILTLFGIGIIRKILGH